MINLQQRVLQTNLHFAKYFQFCANHAKNCPNTHKTSWAKDVKMFTKKYLRENYADDAQNIWAFRGNQYHIRVKDFLQTISKNCNQCGLFEYSQVSKAMLTFLSNVLFCLLNFLQMRPSWEIFVHNVLKYCLIHHCKLEQKISLL